MMFNISFIIPANESEKAPFSGAVRVRAYGVAESPAKRSRKSGGTEIKVL